MGYAATTRSSIANKCGSQKKKKYKQKFIELLKQEVDRSRHYNGQNNNRPYDVLMAYSGGKDSTYTMSLLGNKYKLRVQAVSFDNGFISPAALTNIKNVTDKLGIDHIFFKPRWDLLKKIFSAAAERELYAKKTWNGRARYAPPASAS